MQYFKIIISYHRLVNRILLSLHCIDKTFAYARNQLFLWNFDIYVYQRPHFHVKYNEYECWVTIEDGVITGSLPRRALRMVYEWLDLHKEELMENWERLQNSESPLKINPLR